MSTRNLARDAVLFSVFLLAACPACGAAPQLPPAPPPVTPLATAIHGPPRGPSAELQKMWPFPSPPQIFLYVDVAGLRETKAFGSLVRGLGSIAEASDSSGMRDVWRCGWAAWSSAKEFAVGAGDSGDFFLARFEGAPPLEPCAPAFGSKPAHVEGASQAFDEGDSVAAVQGSFVAWGTPSLVAAAMKSTGTSTGLPQGALGADEYVSVLVSDNDPPVSVRGSLLVSNDKFRLAAEGTLPAAFSGEAEAALTQVRGASFVKGNPDLERLLGSVTFTRTGDHAQAAFELAEPPDAQLRDLGMMLSLGIYGLRKYVAHAKEAEASNVLHEVAARLVDRASKEAGPDAHGAKHAKLRLFAMPAVPGAVPHAVKYQSTHADWQGWEKIHFEISEPQYYQYEVKVAKDGQSAEIVARGDLNGDGKESLFTLKVAVDKESGKLVVAPELEEKDPEE